MTPLSLAVGRLWTSVFPIRYCASSIVPTGKSARRDCTEGGSLRPPTPFRRERVKTIKRPISGPSRQLWQWQELFAALLARLMADQAVTRTLRDVCLWHIADVPLGLTNVRFWGQSGHGADL